MSKRIVYHGTISDFMDDIKSHKKLYSWLNTKNVPVIKASSGYPSEAGLIWLTADYNSAKFYASGGEAVFNGVATKKGLKAEFGGIFEVELDMNLKLALRNQKLTQSEADILNKYIPHYKQVSAGTALNIAVEHRSNGKLMWKDALIMLGYDGIVEKNSKGVDVQIGIIADDIPVNVFYDIDGTKQKIQEIRNKIKLDNNK